MRRRFEHYMAMNPDDIGHGPAGRSRHRHEDCEGRAGAESRRRGRPPYGPGAGRDDEHRTPRDEARGRRRRGGCGPWDSADGPRGPWDGRDDWDEQAPRDPWGGRPPMGARPDSGPRDGWGRPTPPHPGRGRGRRGDVRQAVLRVIAEQPSTGYHVMTAIADRSRNLWKPGPGSIYPALQAMADEGLVSCQEGEGGKKIYTITEAGTSRLAEHPGTAPWERMTRDMAGTLDLRPAMGALRSAVAQAARSGTQAQRRRVAELLDATRRQVYLVLAADEAEKTGEDAAGPDGAPTAPAEN